MARRSDGFLIVSCHITIIVFPYSFPRSVFFSNMKMQMEEGDMPLDSTNASSSSSRNEDTTSLSSLILHTYYVAV